MDLLNYLETNYLFHKAGVKAEIPADIQVDMWEKFTLITAISGVGGVTCAPVGVTRSLPETRQLLIGAMQEIPSVAEAYQIDISPDYVSRTITFIDSLPEGSQPSMQRDLTAGRPSELSDQNGAVVRLGRAWCPHPDQRVPLCKFTASGEKSQG